MCRYCVEYGDGNKWYLNPKTYNPELYKAPLHKDGIEMLGGPGKNTFELAMLGAGIDTLITDVNYVEATDMALENQVGHGAQVVPLEDALKVVDLYFEQYDHPWLRMHCACRKFFGAEPLETCLYAGAIADGWESRPWYKDQTLLSKEEVKDHLRKMSEKGYVHSLWHIGVAQDGLGLGAICNCSYPECMGIRGRRVYNSMNCMRKGEYVSKIDPEKCRNGCGTTDRTCLSYCQFGALSYNSLQEHVFVTPQACFGCGTCRNKCPYDAVEFHERSDYPALVDVW